MSVCLPLWSRLTIAVVYSVEGRLGGEFLRKMRSVLQEMDALTGELEDVCARRFSNSVDALSGVTTRLTLSCHSVISSSLL